MTFAVRRHLPHVLAVCAGMLLWFGASFLSGRREPWDGAVYWGVAYPLALAIAGLLAWRFPVRPWRWALLLFVAQFAAMLLRNGEVGSLWPLGLILFGVLSLPAIVVAAAAAALRRRSGAE